MNLYELLEGPYQQAIQKVKVTDGTNHRTYFIKGAKPEKVIAKAIKTHKQRMGYGATVRGRVLADKEVSAEIVTDKKDE